MNIFVTSDCPLECAKALDDKRVVKMCLETTQMLCTALNECGTITPYKSTHKNHPCNVWARQSDENWKWLHRHGKALCSEYTLRYGKRHKCEDILDKLAEKSHCLPKGQLTPFANCAANASKGINYKLISNVYLAYKLYLNDRWDTDKRIPTWHKI